MATRQPTRGPLGQDDPDGNGPSQSETDTNNQQNAQYLTAITQKIQGGQPPSSSDLQFLDQLGLKYSDGSVQAKSWWEVNWPVVAAVAGVVGFGVFSGLASAASTAAASGDEAAATVASDTAAAGATTAGATTAGGEAGLLGSTATVPTAGALVPGGAGLAGGAGSSGLVAAVTKALGGSVGADTNTVGAIISALGKIGGAALAPTPFQPHEPFGTNDNTDATNTFNTTSEQLGGILKGMEEKAAAPTTLPDAIVQGLPTYTGGELPMSIGMENGPGSLSTPYSLPGLDLSSLNINPDGTYGDPNTPAGPAGPGAPPGTGASPGADTNNPSTPGGGSAGLAPGSGGSHQLASGPQRQSLLGDSGGNTPAAPAGDSTAAALSLLKHVAGGG